MGGKAKWMKSLVMERTEKYPTMQCGGNSMQLSVALLPVPLKGMCGFWDLRVFQEPMRSIQVEHAVVSMHMCLQCCRFNAYVSACCSLNAYVSHCLYLPGGPEAG
eukprot:10283292-Lingulodinium_polyedra.AAC.1